MNWFSAEWHKIVIALLGLDHLRKFIEEVWEPVWKVKAYIERRWHERRHTMSLATIINGITLAEKDATALGAFLANLPEYLPEIQKQLADIQKASADRSNPVALAGDVSTLLGDLSTDMSTIVPMIQNLLPALKTGTVPTAAK